MTAKRGRPKAAVTRQHSLRMRLNDEELQKLEYCAKATGMTKTDIVNQGIDRIYQELIQTQK